MLTVQKVVKRIKLILLKIPHKQAMIRLLKVVITSQLKRVQLKLQVLLQSEHI